MTPKGRVRPVLPKPGTTGDAELRRQLERAAAQWRATFDTIASPIVIVDLAGRIRRLNRAARDLTGRTFQELLGTDAATVGDGPLFATVAALAAKAADARDMATGQVTDPRNGTVWDVVAQFRGRSPEIEDEQVIVVARDITQLVALQESLRRSETLSALGALVAGVAHQVRNPLFGISAALDAFAARFGDREEMRPYVEAIRDPASRLGQLLQELIEYARPATAGRRPADLRHIATTAIRTCRELAERRGVAVAAPADGEPAPVMVDRERLPGALASVIENAVQASRAGAGVEVSVELSATPSGGRAICRVRDHGDGFREEDISHLGEPFFARRHGGTGLGLALVQRVVFENGGTLRFANAAGGGAEVELAFPCAAGDGTEG